jgi:hypothetical protein
MGIGKPEHRESVLVFYVDKHECMIVFMNVVAALARVDLYQQEGRELNEKRIREMVRFLGRALK